MNAVPTAPWSQVSGSLPGDGRVLYACYDSDTVTVFAAHRREIGAWAIEKGRFGGPAWRADRITRFRVSFPRVMARSECGQRPDKEVILGITLRRDRFDAVLRQAVHWREFPDGLYDNQAQWRLATRFSQVVMDWAPDTDASGRDLPRFTVRFGLRKEALAALAADALVGVHNLSELAQAWREAGPDDDPPTPVVRPYPLLEPGMATRLLWVSAA
jgi:hypothetical protein